MPINMSLSLSSNLFPLYSLKLRSHRPHFSSQFINQIQVNSLSLSLPSFPLKACKYNKQKIDHFKASRTTTTVDPTQSSFRNKNPKDINILVVGSTGYIGKFVGKELVDRGFNVICVARERSGIRGQNGKEETLNQLQGANVCFSDVTKLETLERSLKPLAVSIDVVVSCLASRTETSSRRAKLKFEAELTKDAGDDNGFTYSIVRPTAFFKSLGGQVELVKDGKPYVMFGDGRLCACKPISEEDLASFIADCVLSEDKINQILPIGGPGEAVTPLEQGEMLFKLLGKEPKFLKVPIGIMDFAIGVLDFLVKIFPSMEDVAEYGKIGRYHAAESILVLDPETGEYSAEKTPSYGDTLEEFFQRVVREGMAGQELGEQAIF